MNVNSGDETIPAVVLLSGGLDSTTVLAHAVRNGYAAYALSFRYGQRHHIEIDAAHRVAKLYAVREHIIIEIDPGVFRRSALTDTIAVPKRASAMDGPAGIPVTYVPARNTLFLSYALAYAESITANHIFIGVNAVDYSGYPDCRPEYIAAFQNLAAVATRVGVEGQPPTIHAPLITMSKADIIRYGMELGVDYALTHSCYDPDNDGRPCGRCDSCHLRRQGFDDAGIADPAGLEVTGACSKGDYLNLPIATPGTVNAVTVAQAEMCGDVKAIERRGQTE